MQLVDTEAPVVAKNKPAAQLVHVTLPAAVANWPAAHPMQLVDDAAPVVVKYCPAAHFVHAAVLVAVAY